ncbi:hypothetical protein IJS77_03285 [bacterium]|nr:hypothetical protein [bacterium]
MTINGIQNFGCKGIISTQKTTQPSEVINTAATALKTLASDVVDFSTKVKQDNYEEKVAKRFHPYTGLQTEVTKQYMDGKLVGLIENTPDNGIQFTSLKFKYDDDGTAIISGEMIDPKTLIRRQMYGITPNGENAYKSFGKGGDFIIKPDGTEIDLSKLSPQERAELKKTLPQTLFEYV